MGTPYIVITATSGATNDSKFGILRILGFNIRTKATDMKVMIYTVRSGQKMAYSVEIPVEFTSPPGSISSTEVHGPVVTKWLHFVCTIYSPGNFKRTILTHWRRKRMQEVSHYINICPTILKPALFFHRFWWWLPNDTTEKNENFFVGTWILF